MVLICFAANKKEKRSVWPERFFAAVYQIYPEKPLRLFGVLVLMLAERRE